MTNLPIAPVAAGRAALAAALVAAALAAACGEKAPAAPEAAAARPSTPADPNVIAAPATLAERLKVDTVARRAVSEPLSVVGRIDFDEQSVARIGASVTGRVTELSGMLGQTVKAGQVLAQLHSTELGNAQLGYLKANAQRELASKAVERAKLLLAADVIGSAELQRRENELVVAQVEKRAAADQLRVMGMSPREIERTIETGAITSTSSVVSTVNGVVVDRKVNRGQVVQPADVMFIIADLSRVWVVAQVPEAEVHRVQPGQAVTIEVTSSVEPLRGRVAWIADTVNPETRTVTVRTEVDNPKRQLKPEMLANVSIQPTPVERLVVPSSAVVREGNGDHVFVRGTDGRFRLTKVQLADESGGLRVVESGLRGG
ncbi:MAG TPA: efflux RND transporter periplasmic adaptor subunit, partial [Burkholderiaceae bacterium]|nr:efflux RND transporter periplasmic adaptor subunit [Burkholderiaceae bacterium]